MNDPVQQPSNGSINVPPAMGNDFNSEPYIGSMQQVLSDNVGKTVKVDCLVGTDNIVSHTGIIYFVAKQYLVLRQPPVDNYVLMDIYSIKFVTFLNTAAYGA